MSRPVSPPSASLDNSVLVEQWQEILSHHSLSALSAPALRGELDAIVARIVQGCQASVPLPEALRDSLVAAGTQLVELGIDRVESMARAEEALVRWLNERGSSDCLAEVLSAFSQGAYQALQQRTMQSQVRQRDELVTQMEMQSRLGALVGRFNREVGRLGHDEPAIVSLALSLIMRELNAEGAGYFEWKQNRWVLQQAHGTIPSLSFIQPLSSEPPRLEDGLPLYESIESDYQLALPLTLDEENRAVLFVVMPDPKTITLGRLLEALGLLAQALGMALHGAALAGIVQRQLSELRTLETQAQRTTWQRTALRRLGVMIDEEEETSTLTTLPNVPVTIEPQRVVLPLSVRGESFGKLMLEDDEYHDWNEDELELMNVVAEQMSQALEVARLFQESQRRAAQIEAAAEVGRAASSLLALEDLMNGAVNQIRRAFGYYHAQVFLIDDEGKWAVLRSSTGEVGQRLLARNHRLSVGSKSIIGQVTATAKSAVVRDTEPAVAGEITWHFNELLPETRAELAVPLRIGTRVIGALDVQSVSPDVFYEDDIAVLQTLADQMAVAIQNARAFEQQRETAEQLRELDKLKTQFLANMSHELRTPLNSIIGFSRVILKGIDGPVTDLQKKDLTTIYNSGQILLQLIDSILDISKIEAGKMELDFEDVDFRQVVEVALSTAVGLVKDKPVRLLREIPDDLPLIRADSVRLRQVLLNLLSNASKFTDEGHIRVTATRMGDELLVSVDDTGLGIPPDKQQHLFEAFYQVDGSATRKVGGTGLGLAITKSFIELHGGKIWVESQGLQGDGTTFHFTIPIAGPPEKLEEKPIIPLVFAVDDEPGITMLYEKYLTPEGYRFAACHDPLKAVEEAASQQPHIILLDVRMPQMNGFEVIAALRQNILTRDIPVVMCSIEAISKIEDQALGAGASDFLQKPVLRQDLVATVQRWTGTPAVVGAR